MKRLGIILFQLLLCSGIAMTQGSRSLLPFEIVVDEIASGFSSPVDIANAGDSRLFVVERGGTIQILNTDGSTNATPFLDIDDRVINSGGQSEQGLLALEFHPDYATNGFFFVHYTDNDDNTVVSRFTVDPNDENQALVNSEEIIYTAVQPFTNHNGGSIHFSPNDGMLYIGLGDGGAANDPQNLAQNPMSPLGKMIRIDVDNGLPFTIPNDNPFVGDPDILDEIWALGLRNPFRWSFDRLTGDIWIGDVGQGAWEEIDFQAADSEGGENYGWRCREGAHDAVTSGCMGPFDEPVGEYSHQGFTHCSITGGYVYRGAEQIFNDAPPIYLSVDFCSGTFFGTYPEELDGGAFNTVELNSLGGNFPISTFGEDMNGELYVARFNQGRIYSVSATCVENNFNLRSNAASCEEASDGSIILNDNDPPFYDLNVVDVDNPNVALDPEALGPGNYEVTVSRFGCETQLSETVVIIERAPLEFDFFQSQNMSTLSVLNGGSFTIVGTTFEWFLDGELLEGLTTQTIEIDQDGNYTVVITEENGCVLTSEFGVVFANVNVIESISAWELSPNPVQDIMNMTLEVDRAQVFSLSIIDAAGKKVMSRSIEVGGPSNHTIDMSEYADGVYIILLSDGTSTQSQKLVKH